MRELKFRAWSDKYGMYKVGCLVIEKGAGDFKSDDRNFICVHMLYQPFFTIEQSTGIKDKNGKMIYVGDIVKMKYPYDKRFIGKFVVVKDPNSPRIGLIDKTKTDEIFDLYGYMSNYYEVIGNIHENKDLLEYIEKDQKTE